ncbi:MAG: M23 family metallopeptidase [Alphaproteobacteria bacterium]|nr:M23 family metallopeptidase [Alphaproteobacteria bacterium]
MAWKAFFYWLQNHKKIHKIKRIHFNFDWRNKIKPIQLPTAKLVYLKNNSHSLRVAAVIMPFIGLGYFLGYKLACRAEAMPASPRINYNTARDSISPLALFQAKKNFAELNDFYAPPVVRSVYKLEETSLKEQEKETKAETKKEAKKEAKKQTKKETTQQKALAKENNKKAKKQAAQPVVQNDIYYVDGMYMDLQPLNCSNVHISSRFGLRKDPFTGRGRKHYGIDYAAPSGSPIYASADGVVQSANWVRGYGQYIVIKHNDTYSTAYAHMSRFADGINPGTKVQRGQTIGYVGSTGRSTGPHLHFEVKKHGKNIDPFILANSRDYASR